MKMFIENTKELYDLENKIDSINSKLELARVTMKIQYKPITIVELFIAWSSIGSVKKEDAEQLQKELEEAINFIDEIEKEYN